MRNELAQRHGPGELPDPAGPPPAGYRPSGEQVERRLFVGMHRMQRVDDRAPAPDRHDHLDPRLDDLLDFADATDSGLCAEPWPEGADPLDSPCAAVVGTNRAGACRSQRVDEALRVRRRHVDHQLVERLIGMRLERAQGLQPDPVRQRVRYAGVGDVGVGMCDEVGDAAANHSMDQCTLGVVGGHAMHGRQQQRVVGDQQLRARAQRFADGRWHGIDGEQQSLDRFGRISAHQPDGIPRLGPTRVEPPVEHSDDVGEPRHVREPTAPDEPQACPDA